MRRGIAGDDEEFDPLREKEKALSRAYFVTIRGDLFP
jgi:hypothetical protein